MQLDHSFVIKRATTRAERSIGLENWLILICIGAKLSKMCNLPEQAYTYLMVIRYLDLMSIIE